KGCPMRARRLLAWVAATIAGPTIFAGLAFAELPIELPETIIQVSEQAPPPAKEPVRPESQKADTSTAGTPDQSGEKKQDERPPAFGEKNPRVRPLPRAGNFQMPPTGPGYYSLRDLLSGNCRDNPPKYPYPAFALMQSPLFDADFRYLESPKNTQHDPF